MSSFHQAGLRYARRIAIVLGIVLLAVSLAACSRAGGAKEPAGSAESTSKSPAANLDQQPETMRANRWQPPAKPVDEAGVIAAVQAFVPGAKVARPIGGGMTRWKGAVWGVSDGTRSYEVSEAGVVTRVIGVLQWEKPASLPLGQADAMKRAADFMAARFPGFPDVQPDTITYGEKDGTIVASWSQRAASGALLPKYASITVDLNTGALSDFDAQCVNTTVTTQPKIRKEKALETLKDMEGGDLVQDAALMVLAYSPRNPHRLVWFGLPQEAGSLRPGPPDDSQRGIRLPVIDALTGEDATALEYDGQDQGLLLKSLP